MTQLVIFYRIFSNFIHVFLEPYKFRNGKKVGCHRLRFKIFDRFRSRYFRVSSIKIDGKCRRMPNFSTKAQFSRQVFNRFLFISDKHIWHIPVICVRYVSKGLKSFKKTGDHRPVFWNITCFDEKWVQIRTKKATCLRMWLIIFFWVHFWPCYPKEQAMSIKFPIQRYIIGLYLGTLKNQNIMRSSMRTARVSNLLNKDTYLIANVLEDYVLYKVHH